MKFKVEWTGTYPNLCSGEWLIWFDDIPLELPNEIVNEHMNTEGVYEEWFFDDDYMEVFESYEDGLDFPSWYNENRDWLLKLFDENNIPVRKEHLYDLYYKIQEQDWRHNSCGGCI